MLTLAMEGVVPEVVRAKSAPKAPHQAPQAWRSLGGSKKDWVMKDGGVDVILKKSHSVCFVLWLM